MIIKMAKVFLFPIYALHTILNEVREHQLSLTKKRLITSYREGKQAPQRNSD